MLDNSDIPSNKSKRDTLITQQEVPDKEEISYDNEEDNYRILSGGITGDDFVLSDDQEGADQTQPQVEPHHSRSISQERECAEHIAPKHRFHYCAICLFHETGYMPTKGTEKLQDLTSCLSLSWLAKIHSL